MTKTSVNFWLDTFLLCTFLVLCWCSVIVRFIFPPLTKLAGWTLWGLDYAAWTGIQFVTLCVLAVAILVHIMLHWPWVCGVVTKWQRKRQGTSPPTRRYDSSRTLWGVGLLIVIINVLGLGIAVAALTIQGPAIP